MKKIWRNLLLICMFSIASLALTACNKSKNNSVENSTNPSNSSNPNTPSDPSNPSNPSTPSDPSNPSGPNNPSNPSDPSGPNNPSNPSTPTNPYENYVIEYSNDGYIYLGTYASSIKSDSVTVSATPDSDGYYLGSDGYKYVKESFNLGQTWNYSTRSFSNGKLLKQKQIMKDILRLINLNGEF